ncbi:MAG: helix-turn-helix domain-containing protein [Candidatus ainarchaeum sp.]|nr:helix-turn-helix domain-containing protein [Candidatus ainarchaeum sp.]
MPITNNIMLSDLNNRQKEIISILKKEKIVTQKYLLEKLNIPKGSLSRNLKSLEAKELIEIKKFGLTNKIKIK